MYVYICSVMCVCGHMYVRMYIRVQYNIIMCIGICDWAWENRHICTSTGFLFLSVCESYTHVLPRNTKYLMIDGQVCFHRRLFTDARKPR